MTTFFVRNNFLGKFYILSSIVLFSTLSSYSQVCDKWVFGYVPTYTQAQFGGSINYLTAFEYSKLTHIGHLGPYVNADGSFNMSSNGATNIRMQQAVAEAHNHNKPILIAFQGWYDTYMPAISNAISRSTLINNVLDLLDTYGYDGVDIDLEPIMSPWVSGMQTDNPNYKTFVNLLYDSLQVRTCSFTGKKPLLSVAANGYAGPVLNDLQVKFDMINILTYDLSGAYPGWVPWHDSPVYNGNNINPHTGQLMPSVHDEILSCINAGVAPPKLGVGISYDAFQWKGGDGTSTGGVTAPLQVYTSDPTWTRFSYVDFVSNYYSGGTYHYDNSPQMAYYSKDNVGSANDEFWSFNDQPSIQDKVDYVWDHSLGGMMIWELHSGYFANNSSAEKIPQLNYINDQNCLRAAPCPDPYPLCSGESYTLTATGAFTGIQWYKDGNVIPTPLGTSAILIVDEIGIYTWVGMDADGCDINNCCAIQIVEGNCCSITQTHTTPVCQNNGTGGISTDDFVNMSVTPTLTGGSANVVLKIGTWTSSNIPSGQQVMLTGNGLAGNPLIPANGSDIIIIIEDSLDSNCFTSFDINSSSCSQCPTLNCGTVSVQKN